LVEGVTISPKRGVARLIGLGAAGCVLLGGLAWAAWTFALDRHDDLFRGYERAAKARSSAARPQPASAETFRVTVCAATPCLLVEAGGLAFVVGAGDGAASDLAALGLLRPDLDGVLLMDIHLASIEGLPGLRHDTWHAGRRAPLPVYGPPGVERVVDGVNLMLAASDILESKTVASPPPSPDGAPLSVGLPPSSEGISGAAVFDSGVVAIRSFPVEGQGGGRVYRFDFNNRSLIVAGCAARSADILAAARGTRLAVAVLPAASRQMLEIDRSAAAAASSRVPQNLVQPGGSPCLSHDEAFEALRDARLSGGLLAPLYPPASTPAALATWRQKIAARSGLIVGVGEVGSAIDLTGEAPAIRTLRSIRKALSPKSAADPPVEPTKPGEAERS
jgi:ribonuclease Z